MISANLTNCTGSTKSVLTTSDVIHSVVARLSKKTKSIAEKQKNLKGQTCWDGYKRHPTIKEGPGSCIPIK